MKKILIIEDDDSLLKALNEALTTENFKVECVNDGNTGFRLAMNNYYDLIILDLVLPGMNGIDICKDLRMSKIDTPILMLTGKKEEVDKILGLEIGGDDYVTKPFSMKELMARVKAILRRKIEHKPEVEEYVIDNLYIDFRGCEAGRNEQKIEFSATELKILKFFILHEGEVIDRNRLLDEVWGYETFPTTRTVDNFILSLRKKIEENPSEPRHILTVHKAGYKFIK